MLKTIEVGFMKQVSPGGSSKKSSGGSSAEDHAKVLDKTLGLMTSKQMEAFKADREPTEVQERYGKTGFGRGCLMARRLVEQGVSFVEVDLGGWDTHANNFKSLADQKLPELDKAMQRLDRRPGPARTCCKTRPLFGWASSAAPRGSTAPPVAITGLAAGALWWAAPA